MEVQEPIEKIFTYLMERATNIKKMSEKLRETIGKIEVFLIEVGIISGIESDTVILSEGIEYNTIMKVHYSGSWFLFGFDYPYTIAGTTSKNISRKSLKKAVELLPKFIQQYAEKLKREEKVIQEFVDKAEKIAKILAE